MKLVMSKNTIVNTTLYDESTGQPVYQIRTAFKVAGNRRTIISRVHPGSSINGGLRVRENRLRSDGASDVAPLLDDAKAGVEEEGEDEDFEEAEDAEENDHHLDTNFLAEVHWSVLGPSKMRLPFTNEEIRTSEYLHYCGFLWQNRWFTGPDGQIYKWKNACTLDQHLILELDNGDRTSTIVACSRTPNAGFFSLRSPRSLEIFGDQRQDVMDAIVITFVYMEKLRREKMKTARLG